MAGEKGTIRVCLGALALLCLLCLVLSARAIAAPGDVYFTDQGFSGSDGGAIYKVGPSGGVPQVAAKVPDATPDPDPNGLAMDRHGLLYFVSYDGVIRTANRSTGAVGVFTTFPGSPSLADIAIGPDQNIYVTDSDNPGALFRIDAATKAVSTVASDFTPEGSPEGLAIARDGTMYVSDNQFKVYRVTPAGAVSLLADSPTLSGADGLALTPDERTLYIGSYGSPDGQCCDPPNSISKIDLATGALTRFAEVEDSVAVTLRSDGSILNTNTNSNLLEIVGASGSPETDFTAPGPDLGYPHDTVIEPQTCGGLFPTVVGTTGPDNLVGSPFPDVISTLGGKDTVKGGGGNDIICGGPGKDKLFGQGGRDKLFGQGGKDRLVGGKKKDVDKGGGGADVCVGKGDKLKSC